MIDTQRLGALLRALMRDEVLTARLRTPAAAPVRPTAVIGPELPRPDPQAHETAPAAQAQHASHPNAAPGARYVTHAVANDADAMPSAVLRLADRPALSPDAGATSVAHESTVIDSRPSASTGRSTITPPAAQPSAALELSDTGRALLSALRLDAPPAGPISMPGSAMQPLLHASEAAHAAAAPTPGAQARPLVAVPPHSEFATDRLALQLKDAVEFSGVFYESHLAQWADDMRPRALLAHEPQSRWPVAADIAQQAAMPAPPADYAAPVLRQQLEVLDTGRFMWTGDLWPGQRASLVIEEDDTASHEPGEHASHAPRWRLRIVLELSELGAVDATLRLAGDTLDLLLRCDRPEVAAKLREATPVLRTAIAERALDLAHMSIADGQA
jgi:hypothetical protein